MQTEHRLRKNGFGQLQLLLAGTALAAFSFLVDVPRVHANEAECQHRISRADRKLHEAVERHGWNSRQADHARHDLRDARAYCWSTSHRWWDEDERRWRMERDWDEEHGRPH